MESTFGNINELKKVFEADPFQGVDPEDLKKRRTKEENDLALLKEKAKDIIGKGVAVWQDFPYQAWPEGKEEGKCPVCGNEYGDNDFQEEDSDDWELEQHLYICGTCGSGSEMKFEVTRTYISTEVTDLPEDQQIPPYESVMEAGDPFKGADPSDVEKRKEESAEKRRRLVKEKGIIPIDKEAFDIDLQRWSLTNRLVSRLKLLRQKYNVDETCICNVDDLEMLGEDRELIILPGREGDYLDYWCARCGGFVEHD